MESLRQRIKDAESRARSLKSKKTQTKAWDKVKELKHELFILMCDQRDTFSTFSIKGKVKSARPGEDYIIVDTCHGTLFLSPANDIVSKSWYSQTCCVEYINDQEIIIECEVDINHDSLKLQLVPKRIYGGKLNNDQYTELCKQSNLAFFKYPTGMSGLFA